MSSIKKDSIGNLARRPEDRQGLPSTESGALKANPYGFNTPAPKASLRTNPEELIGAAHAGCFSMAFSMILGESFCLTAGELSTPSPKRPWTSSPGWFYHHRRAPDPRQGARCRQGEIRGAGQQAKAGMSGIQGAQGPDQPGRHPGGPTPAQIRTTHGFLWSNGCR